tara:strand:+ start:27081 stop:27251 length:171 start_codon:yes stop_codon:yes gene_type:complete
MPEPGTGFVLGDAGLASIEAERIPRAVPSDRTSPIDGGFAGDMGFAGDIGFAGEIG